MDLQDHEFRLVACQPVLLQDQSEPGLVELGLVSIVHLRGTCGGATAKMRGNAKQFQEKKNTPE